MIQKLLVITMAFFLAFFSGCGGSSNDSSGVLSQSDFSSELELREMAIGDHQRFFLELEPASLSESDEGDTDTIGSDSVRITWTFKKEHDFVFEEDTLRRIAIELEDTEGEVLFTLDPTVLRQPEAFGLVREGGSVRLTRVIEAGEYSLRFSNLTDEHILLFGEPGRNNAIEERAEKQRATTLTERLALPSNIESLFPRSGTSVTSDCTGCNFGGRDFNGTHISDVNLTNAKFWDAGLVHVQFSNVDLKSAQFRGASLQGVTMTDCDLSHAVLDEAFLPGTTFTRVNLTSVQARNLRDTSGFVCNDCTSVVGKPCSDLQCFEEPSPYENVTVKNGEIGHLGCQHYGTVTIEAGGTIEFSGPLRCSGLHIDELQVNGDSLENPAFRLSAHDGRDGTPGRDGGVYPNWGAFPIHGDRGRAGGAGQSAPVITFMIRRISSSFHIVGAGGNGGNGGDGGHGGKLRTLDGWVGHVGAPGGGGGAGGNGPVVTIMYAVKEPGAQITADLRAGSGGRGGKGGLGSVGESAGANGMDGAPGISTDLSVEDGLPSDR
jgi:hypothetical protein